MLTLLVFLALFSGCSGGYSWDVFGFIDDEWDGLEVRWDFLPTRGFFDMPRTVSDALAAGFTKLSDCDVNANWRGARYVKDNDLALILLFDKLGTIAGIQSSVPNNQSNGFPFKPIRPPFCTDGDRYVITAYFTDPAKICTTGRPASDLDTEGTGSNLYIQNSTKPEESVIVPRDQANIGSTLWTEGKCFPTMGKHYWYNLTEDMSCEDIFPMFLLYNGGQLNAFGWAFITSLPSPKYEHPGPESYPKFMEPVPKCLANAGVISTLHIYLTNTAAGNLC